MFEFKPIQAALYKLQELKFICLISEEANHKESLLAICPLMR